LLPAIVALYQRALGSIDMTVVAPWLRVSYAVLFLIYALTVLIMARRFLSAPFAVAAVAISLLQVNTLFMSDLLFTELPFALIAVLFVLVSSNGLFRSHPWLRETVSFVLAGAGFLLRTAGLALLIAWVLESCIGRRRLLVARSVLALLPVAAWQIHVARVHGSYEYAHPAYEYQRAPYQFYNVSYAENSLSGSSPNASISIRAGAFASRLAGNLRVLGKRLGEAISSSQGYWNKLLSGVQQRVLGRQIISPRLVLAPILALSFFVIVGIGVLVRRRAWLIIFVILTSLGLICITPWTDQFQRYLMPVTPFLAIAAMLAGFEINKMSRGWPINSAIKTTVRIGVLGIFFLGLVVELYAAWDLFAARQRGGASFVAGRGTVGPRFFYVDPLWHGLEQAIAWIQEHSAPDAIVATPYSHFCYLKTGRRAVSPPVDSDPARIRHLLDSVPVSYVIVDYGYSLPAVESDAADWRLLQSFDGTKLYQRNIR
jgi:hypothetical protein